MRSVSMRTSATHESGHSYFAQTGHSHFAATIRLSGVDWAALWGYDTRDRGQNRNFWLNAHIKIGYFAYAPPSGLRLWNWLLSADPASQWTISPSQKRRRKPDAVAP